MRLHDLSVTAFGPFVDTVHVDFDTLSAGGLFLLTGDTGAGKTSILDAVCFALYGEVPGDRHTAKHLRSDHADPGAEPRVVLRMSIGERTFRFTRSPAWDRPKRRGTGTTRVQAHVVVEELDGGHWTALTNRLDEAGQLVTTLLGMTVTQFTQVAMLPQGRFQAFLRASSAERQAVLQRLFRTRRFEDVERWLAERRLTLHRQGSALQARTAATLNRVVEASGEPVPADLDLDDLEALMTPDQVTPWVEGLLDAATATTESCARLQSAAVERLENAGAELARAHAVTEARARGRRAAALLQELEGSVAVERELEAALQAHRRAAAVVPAVRRAALARASHAIACRHLEQSLVSLRGELGLDEHEQIDSELVETLRTRAGEECAVARAWVPREIELEDRQARHHALSAQLAGLATTITTHEAQHRTLLLTRKRRETRLGDLGDVARRVPHERVALEAAELGVRAAEQVMVLREELASAETRLRAATDHALELREQYLDLRERRIAGMAGELATGLAVGCSCPVCGSSEHPSPARGAGLVSRAEEEAARDRHESADFERQARQEAVATLRAELSGQLTRAMGHGVAHWRATAREAGDRLDTAVAAAGAFDDLDRVHREDERLLSELEAGLERDRALVRERTAHLHELTGVMARLESERAALLEHHPEVSTVADLTAVLEHRSSALQEICQQLAASDRAAAEVSAAEAEALTLAEGTGFETPEAAVAAQLPDDLARGHERELRRRLDDRAAARSVLEEPAVVAALSAPLPEVEALQQAHEEAAAERDRTHSEHAQATRREQRLRALGQELGERVRSWEPVLREHAAVAELCSLVEGKSSDNRLKMRLSAYVLSERLRQVVAAANERLGVMTDARYTLEQADARGAGEQRGGLSLRVRDEWNGHHRDPATLSGGETFLVSLALALGLADTVSNEAGGTQLDTLFIDEGFGALDASTLDTVMDTLDSLRDGGRVVGLVSHVAELRNRVPAQLEVRKARRGSTVRPVVAAG